MTYQVETRETILSAGVNGTFTMDCIDSRILASARAAADSVLVAELYSRRRGAAPGGLFTLQDGTPMLHALNRHLQALTGRLRVVDVGANEGVQALVIAREVSHASVFAVETDPQSIAVIRRKLLLNESPIKEGSLVAPRELNVFNWLRQQGAGTVHGVHANSWGHFLPEETERVFLELACAAQSEGGVIAISQKSVQDGLLALPTTRLVDEERGWIRAVPADGIERRFQRDADELARRVLQAGYASILGTYEWSVPGYDDPKRPDVIACFVGVLAQK